MENISELLSSICIPCGLCCDGTLFDKANLKDNTDKSIAIDLGLTVINQSQKKQSFKLPCQHFKSCCTVYKQPRPAVCHEFFCLPLKKLQKGELSFEKAKGIVGQAIAMRDDVEQLISKIDELKVFPLTQLFNEITPKPTNFIRKYDEVMIKMIAIKTTLSGIPTKN